MIIFVSVIHIIACIALILIVLLQAGKGADIGASMGGAGGQALFGSSGATTVLSKVTTGIAVLFMLTSLFLAYQSGHAKDPVSVMKDITPVTDKAAMPKNDVPATIPADNAGTEATATDTDNSTSESSETP